MIEFNAIIICYGTFEIKEFIAHNIHRGYVLFKSGIQRWYIRLTNNLAGNGMADLRKEMKTGRLEFRFTKTFGHHLASC